MHRRFSALAVSAALLFSACAESAAGSPVTTPAYLSFRDQPTACASSQPPSAIEMSFDAPDDMGLSEVTHVVLTTSCGEVELALYPEVAPITVNSFVFLSEQGYFDGTVLHRVVPGFMVQMGDPGAGGGGGAPGYLLPDELPPADYIYPQGVVAMANAGPNTAGSQFFIMAEDTALPPNYSVFGMVTSGFDAIVRMTSVPLGPNPAYGEDSRPMETIYIEHVEVVGR